MVVNWERGRLKRKGGGCTRRTRWGVLAEKNSSSARVCRTKAFYRGKGVVHTRRKKKEKRQKATNLCLQEAKMGKRTTGKEWNQNVGTLGGQTVGGGKYKEWGWMNRSQYAKKIERNSGVSGLPQIKREDTNQCSDELKWALGKS